LGSASVPLAMTTPLYSAVSTRAVAASMLTRQRVPGASLTGSTRSTRVWKRKCARRPKRSAKSLK
jgi:hypothetical protein